MSTAAASIWRIIEKSGDPRIIIGPVIPVPTDGAGEHWKLLIAGDFGDGKFLGFTGYGDGTEACRGNLELTREEVLEYFEAAGGDLYDECDLIALFTLANEFWPHPEWAEKIAQAAGKFL
jgi:hypothetical protein